MYIGMDVHKDTTTYAVALPGRTKGRYRGEIAHTRKAVNKRLQRLSEEFFGELLLFCLKQRITSPVRLTSCSKCKTETIPFPFNSVPLYPSTLATNQHGLISLTNSSARLRHCQPDAPKFDRSKQTQFGASPMIPRRVASRSSAGMATTRSTSATVSSGKRISDSPRCKPSTIMRAASSAGTALST